MSREIERPRVDVAALRRRPGAQLDVERILNTGVLKLIETVVAAGTPIEVHLGLEAISGGVQVRGTVDSTWVGECRRCLEPTSGAVHCDVSELFADDAVEGETYPITNEVIDLEELARDVIMLDLPVAPLCSSDCPGPLPDVFPVTVEVDDSVGIVVNAPLDPRWAALDVLREPSGGPDAAALGGAN